MKLMSPKRSMFMNARLLFVIEGCPYCRLYKSFIEEVNQKLDIRKRIKLVDCTLYHSQRIVTDSRIPLFFEYYKGIYPTLFLNGGIIRGANTNEELVAWIKSRLTDDFTIPEDKYLKVNGKEIPLTHEQSCKFKKTRYWGRTVVCE